jgi:hypothetical protein
VNEAKPRQRSLLDDSPGKPLPKEIEAKAFQLLVQLLLAVVPAISGEKRDEQD